MKLGCHFYQCGERVGFHLLHHLPTMCFYRDFADAQFTTNLFVQEVGGGLSFGGNTEILGDDRRDFSRSRKPP